MTENEHQLSPDQILQSYRSRYRKRLIWWIPTLIVCLAFGLSALDAISSRSYEGVTPQHYHIIIFAVLGGILALKRPTQSCIVNGDMNSNDEARQLRAESYTLIKSASSSEKTSQKEEELASLKALNDRLREHN